MTGHHPLATFRRHGRGAAHAVLGGLLIVHLSCAAGSGERPHHEEAPAPEGTPREVSMTPEQIGHAGVRWEAAQAATTADFIEVPAHLGADEDRTAQVSAPAPGRVTHVHVRVGDRVARGARLVTLQSPQGATARAEFARAQAELQARTSAAQYARTAVGRAERLLELKAMSRQEAERARVETEAADAARLQAEAELQRARAALEQLGVDTGTGDLVLRAPLGGLVLARDAMPGSVVDAGAPLVTVSDVSTLWLHISLPEGVAAMLRPGASVRFRIPALGTETMEATLQNIGAALDATTRTLPAQAAVSNASGRLRPAMFATAEIPQGEPRAGVAVPASALQLLDNAPVVFIAQPDGRGGARFERRDVETGTRTAEQVPIVSGLRPGDLVVTEGAFAVKSEFARGRMPAG
jgi:membrane fusion protein, heavy metal efflux system